MRQEILLACLIATATLTAGCLGGSGSPAEPTQADADDASPASASSFETVEVSEDGRVGAAVATCGIGDCVGYGVGHDRRFPMDPDGRVDSASLTLTWDTETPATNELRLGFSYGGCNEDGFDCENHEIEDGTSPVELGTDAPDAEGPVVLWVYVPDGSADTYVALPQDFHLEGTLTVDPGAGG